MFPRNDKTNDVFKPTVSCWMQSKVYLKLICTETVWLLSRPDPTRCVNYSANSISSQFHISSSRSLSTRLTSFTACDTQYWLINLTWFRWFTGDQMLHLATCRPTCFLWYNHTLNLDDSKNMLMEAKFPFISPSRLSLTVLFPLLVYAHGIVCRWMFSGHQFMNKSNYYAESCYWHCKLRY